jgi:hypothetical protein
MVNNRAPAALLRLQARQNKNINSQRCHGSLEGSKSCIKMLGGEVKESRRITRWKCDCYNGKLWSRYMQSMAHKRVMDPLKKRHMPTHY